MAYNTAHTRPIDDSHDRADETEFVNSGVPGPSKRPASIVSIAGSRLMRVRPLPKLLTEVVGRHQHEVSVSNLLRKPAVRLVTLTGPGGVGKTRLALSVAEQLEPEFSEGATFVSLSVLAEPDLLLFAIAQAVGIREQGERPILDRLITSLYGLSLIHI